MKKLGFVIMFLLVTSLCFAAIVNDGGVAYTPVTKTHTGGSTLQIIETDRVVWTPASGQKIVLLGVKYSSDLATTLLIENGSTAIVPVTECTASGQIVVGNGTPIWKGGADETLTYTTNAVSRHSILMWGYETSN